MLTKMNKNHPIFKLTKIHSEFTDIKTVDEQTLPINFALIHTAFLILTHKEHSKLARNATNLKTG